MIFSTWQYNTLSAASNRNRCIRWNTAISAVRLSLIIVKCMCSPLSSPYSGVHFRTIIITQSSGVICPVYLIESTSEPNAAVVGNGIASERCIVERNAPRQSESVRQQAVSTTKRADIIWRTHRVLPSILTRSRAHISRPYGRPCHHHLHQKGGGNGGTGGIG